MSEQKIHAIGLVSGGLDSLLATHTLLEQGIEVTAINFMTHFGCDGTGGSCGHDISGIAHTLGFNVKICHLGEDYIKMVRNPKYGHGKNMNPCHDCRIMMIETANAYREALGADFIFTGEVLGQRPKSQRKDAILTTDKVVELEGLIVRPLSALALPPTIPEEKGWIDRNRLYGIVGRSRKMQYELAEKYGIEDIPQPAGGCLLTDPGYSAKLKDLFDHTDGEPVADIMLLRVGRHFRLSDTCKVLVGRNHEENQMLDVLSEPGDWWLEMMDTTGPLTVIRGADGHEYLKFAAGLTTRYAQVPAGQKARVRAFPKGRDAEEQIFEVEPLTPPQYEPLRVGEVSAMTAAAAAE